MFFWGSLGILQVLVLPGALILRSLKVRGSLIQLSAYVMGLSLIANYLLALILTLAGLFIQPVLLVLAAAELAALVWLFRYDVTRSLMTRAAVITGGARRFMQSLIPSEPLEDRSSLPNLLRAALTLLFVVLALSSIAWVGRVLIDNLGAVFNTWDAVHSWNRWAEVWAHNQIPMDTLQYPQLIPANWAVIYVMTGNTLVQFFAKAIMPLFSLLILLMIFDLGLDARAMGLFIAVTLTRLMLKKFLGEFITAGYVDIPVAWFGFLAVYALLKARSDPEPHNRTRAVQLGLIFAAGAAVTKLAGLFIFALYPLLAWLLVSREGFSAREEYAARELPAEDRRGTRMQTGAFIAAALLTVLPWYIFKQVQIWQGADVSNIAWVTGGIFSGAGLLQRVQSAVLVLDKYAYVLAFLVPALLVLDKAYRWLVVLIVLPFTILWALFFSYDTRNLALALPFLGITAGAGIGRTVELALDLLARLGIGKLRAWVLPLLLLLALAAGAWVINDNVLIERQVAQQRQIFSPELNQKLYDAIAGQSPGAKILTNYPVAYLPGLEDNQVSFWFSDPELFTALLEDDSITHMLVPSYAAPEINQQIEQQLASGAFQLLFEDNSYISYRFIRIR
jgi:hypothetical protein